MTREDRSVYTASADQTDRLGAGDSVRLFIPRQIVSRREYYTAAGNQRVRCLVY